MKNSKSALIKNKILKKAANKFQANFAEILIIMNIVIRTQKTNEVILIDGHKIILSYADRPQPKVMGNIQDILFNQNLSPTKGPEICNQGDNMR